MTVKEMIELLQDLPQDHKVIMSKDSEGNSFSPFEDYSEGIYTEETTWYGDWRQDEDLEKGEKENAICLWPVN